MAKIKGKELMVFVGGKAVGTNKECTLEISVELGEVASKSSGGWKEYLAKRKGWSVSSTHLMTDTLMMSLESWIGKEMTVAFSFSESSTSLTSTDERTMDGGSFVGKAILNKAKVSGNYKGMAAGQFEWQGTGELKAVDNYTYLIDNDDEFVTVRKYPQ